MSENNMHQYRGIEGAAIITLLTYMVRADTLNSS